MRSSHKKDLWNGQLYERTNVEYKWTLREQHLQSFGALQTCAFQVCVACFDLFLLLCWKWSRLQKAPNAMPYYWCCHHSIK